MSSLTQPQNKSLGELIPKDFTMEHDGLIRRLMRENKEAYEEIFDLAQSFLDDPHLCRRYNISYCDQTRGDLLRVMSGYAIQKNYIEPTSTK